jgi:hypothetical protein
MYGEIVTKDTSRPLFKACGLLTISLCDLGRAVRYASRIYALPKADSWTTTPESCVANKTFSIKHSTKMLESSLTVSDCRSPTLMSQLQSSSRLTAFGLNTQLGAARA